jgi:hypothetical protein
MTNYKLADFKMRKFDFLLLCNKWNYGYYEKKNHSKGY